MTSDRRTRLFGKDYHDTFDPVEYLKDCSPSCFDLPEQAYLRSIVDSLHDVFSVGEIQGKRLLDVGSGPSIHTVISAAPWFDEITLSDYTAQNRDALKQWVNNDPAKFDFDSFFEYISKLQYRESSNPTDLENLVRSKIFDIVPCDVTSPMILQSSGTTSSYDCIVSSLCLEAAVPDLETYKDALKKIALMLTSVGHFVQVGCLDETCYRFGNFEYFVLPLTRQTACDSLTEVGFVDVTWREISFNDNLSDCTGFFVLNAKKGS